jgi:uncharacterized protein (TIGR03083 family)
MENILFTQEILDAGSITPLNKDEAYKLLDTELSRFLALVETLDSNDWDKATACAEWSVRDILAHQAGGYASGCGYREMFRQTLRIPGKGQLIEDAINDFQLKERTEKTPVELINELRQVGPVAANKWAYQFRFGKLFSIPHPIAGTLSLRYLMWVTHSRDTWMHRLDICRATGREFKQTKDHDGRIAELVMLDVARLPAIKNHWPTLVFELTGIAGGSWKIGRGEPQAVIHMDVLDFNVFASGRYSFPDARPLMSIDGNINAAEDALKNFLILY